MTNEYAAECLEEMLCDYQVYNHNYYGVAEIPVDPDGAEALKVAIKLLKSERRQHDKVGNSKKRTRTDK